MKRWAWNIFCAFSLLVFATSVTLWVRSYFVADTVSLGIRSSAWYFRSEMGELIGGRYWTTAQYSFTGDLGYHRLQASKKWHAPKGSAIRINASFAGFSVYEGGNENFLVARRQCVVAPLWLFLIFALPPAMWWRKWRRMRGERKGRGFPVKPMMKAECLLMNEFSIQQFRLIDVASLRR